MFTTKYNRWYSDERSSLLSNLEYIEGLDLVIPGIIPKKIGKKIERDLLIQLRSEPQLSKYLSDQQNKFKMWYHNAPQYWIRAMDFAPKFSSKKGDVSSSLKVLYAKKETLRKVIISILNSSLFYWFFVVSSDGRHLNLREIENFGIDLENMTENRIKDLTTYCDNLMEDYKKHSRMKKTNYSNHGKITYQEFFPKYSKNIIDKIDKTLADHYKFSKEQKEFILNFDLNFRMNEDEN